MIFLQVFCRIENNVYFCNVISRELNKVLKGFFVDFV